ncbi:ribosomal RNA large subunit methyltransferase Cfr [Lachnospiraceae bacterium]|nr:ribosomal RNA large subunit methyltransferase Cfr [Lachnospiraceae bacterium]
MKVRNNLKNLGIFKDFTDGTIKSVFRSSNQGVIEITLLFNKPDMDVLCLPTHHFCNLGCKICHLTNNALNKRMVPIEIDDMIEAIIKASCFNLADLSISTENLDSDILKRRTEKKKLMLSFMGVGEPLLNLNMIENLIKRESELKSILHYSDISYALATMIPNDNMSKLIDLVTQSKVALKVHFSLHSPYDTERAHLLPSSKTTVREALSQLKKYSDRVFENEHIRNEYKKFHKSNIPVEIHYTLIRDVNDSQEHLNEVIRLLLEYKIPIKFIRFNETGDLKVSNMENIWVMRISGQIPGLKIKTYSPPGKHIGSSCGEFTKHYYHEEIESPEQYNEFINWEKEHKIYENYRKDFIAWDEYYMGVAILSSKRSKDPSTQVGACIVSSDNRILSVGYNGTPNAIDDERFNWSKEGDRLENKYAYVIHAEVNSILNFKGNTNELSGATLYVTLFPCNECAKFIVQCGIKKVVYLSDKYHKKRETGVAKNIFDSCRVKYIKFTKRNNIQISYEEI